MRRSTALLVDALDRCHSRRLVRQVTYRAKRLLTNLHRLRAYNERRSRRLTLVMSHRVTVQNRGSAIVGAFVYTWVCLHVLHSNQLLRMRITVQRG